MCLVLSSGALVPVLLGEAKEGDEAWLLQSTPPCHPYPIVVFFSFSLPLFLPAFLPPSLSHSLSLSLSALSPSSLPSFRFLSLSFSFLPSFFPSFLPPSLPFFLKYLFEKAVYALHCGGAPSVKSKSSPALLGSHSLVRKMK